MADGGTSIVDAWKGSTRTQRAMIGLVLLYFLSAVIVLLAAWGRHKPPMYPWLIAYAMVSMLAISVWHSVMVKGWRQTIPFFLIAWAVSWFCEFIGHNYAWFFGTYKYTDTLGPRIGGVPIVITVTWTVVIYPAFMLIDWLVGLKGEKRARSWWGKGLWAALIAAATATLVCAWDLMVDPVATSRVWKIAVDKAPWWWWRGGPYLRELRVWKGKGGIPIGNFVGWWLAPFMIVFIFYLFFQRPNVVSDRLVNTVPLLIYAYIYVSLAPLALQMNWFEDGFTEVALIGTFTMMPVIGVSLVKLWRDHS